MGLARDASTKRSVATALTRSAALQPVDLNEDGTVIRMDEGGLIALCLMANSGGEPAMLQEQNRESASHPSRV